MRILDGFIAGFLPSVQCSVISFDMSFYCSSDVLSARFMGSELPDFLEERLGEFMAKVLRMSPIGY